MKPGVDWDDNLIARLAALHSDGKNSFKEIADTLNHEFGLRLTKNSCIGKARRLGLEQRPRGTPQPKPKPRKKRTPDAPKSSVISAWKVEPPRLPAATGRITIYQLELGRCHFPFGERPPYAYCGGTAFRGSSWCPHHEAVVYPRGHK